MQPDLLADAGRALVAARNYRCLEGGSSFFGVRDSGLGGSVGGTFDAAVSAGCVGAGEQRRKHREQSLAVSAANIAAIRSLHPRRSAMLAELRARATWRS